MRKYKGLVIGIIVLIVLLFVVIGIYLYRRSNDTTIPKDAKCVATIYQKEDITEYEDTGDYYTYDFYPKSKNKYIVQKRKNYDPGIVDVSFTSKIVYTKIVKKSDINKIEKDIQKEINEYDNVTYEYYGDDGNMVICNSLQELFEKLF